MSPIADADYAIRRMHADEVDLALDWAAAEGWNPGIHDARAFHTADPDGFLIGEIDGEPVGCIAAVAYDGASGFIGLYIVARGFRGRGFGLRLWNAGVAYLGERTIGLDGVVSQQANYRRSGFELAYRNVRYEGIAPDVAAPSGVVDASSVPFERIADYDRRMFAASREAFLRAWLVQPEGASLVAFKDDRVQGYGVLRACRHGYKIGPLFADDPAIADDLYRALVARVPGATVYLDVPEANPQALALAERHGLSSVFETARMYTKAPPAVPVGCVFGVTSFELG